MNAVEIRKLLRRQFYFIAPDWWECQWRRNPCNRPECPLCGRMIKQRYKHQFKGEDPDSMESAVQDIGDSFAETMMMLQQAAKEQGIDLDAIPEDGTESPPDEFPISNKATEWAARLNQFAKWAGDECTLTDEGQNLMWYANLIPAKAYRNLCSVWRFNKGQLDDRLDYTYTQYVIGECIKIVKGSLASLTSAPPPFGHGLNELYREFLDIEEDVMSI